MKNAMTPWSLIWEEAVDSTNDRLKDLARAGAPEGTCVAAGMQTGGRGRQGRRFVSPAGTGMYFSALLRPEAPVEECMHLTCAVAVAAAQAVEQICGITPQIKWPNDLCRDGRKLGGILTEVSARDGRLEWAVVGIGINCRTPAGGFPDPIRQIAASLEEMGGSAPEPRELARAMAEKMRDLAATFLSEKARWMEEFQKLCVTTGRDVCVISPSDSRRGRALEVDLQGGLIVEFLDGSREVVSSGEVSVRGIYGYL